jgi:hypothetical protein
MRAEGTCDTSTEVFERDLLESPAPAVFEEHGRDSHGHKVVQQRLAKACILGGPLGSFYLLCCYVFRGGVFGVIKSSVRGRRSTGQND